MIRYNGLKTKRELLGLDEWGPPTIDKTGNIYLRKSYIESWRPESLRRRKKLKQTRYSRFGWKFDNSTVSLLCFLLIASPLGFVNLKSNESNELTMTSSLKISHVLVDAHSEQSIAFGFGKPNFLRHTKEKGDASKWKSYRIIGAPLRRGRSVDWARGNMAQIRLRVVFDSAMQTRSINAAGTDNGTVIVTSRLSSIPGNPSYPCAGDLGTRFAGITRPGAGR